MIDRSLFLLPGVRKLFAILSVFAFIVAFLVVGQAFSLTTAVTNLWYGGAVSDQLIWVGAFLLCFVTGQGIAYIQDTYLEKYAYTQADSLRQSLLEKVFFVGPEIVQESGTGNTTTLVLEGVEQVENYLRLILPRMIRVAIVPILLLIPVFAVEWISGVILLVVFPAIIFYMVLIGKASQSRAAKQHNKFQIMSNHFIDSLRGIATLKVFGVSKRHGEEIYEVSEDFRKATMSTIRIATLSSLVLDLFATLSMAAVAIMLGLRLLDGSLELFPALFVLVLVPEYFKPIREFASDFHASLDGKNALVSIRALIDKKTKEEARDTSTDLSWTNDSRMSVKDLGFSYDETKVLDEVAFDVSGYSKIGIIGTSGAGKSTLMKVLAGFALPDEGNIVIGDCELDSLHSTSWQKQATYLPQDPYIFHATLRDNIAFYYPNAAEGDIDEAVRIVGMEEFVSELSEGIQTKIGEGERALSGGQAQRIALARLCLDTKRKILLFDEPTAHLDIETEMELKSRMLPLMEDRLVFFATHRLHWMNDMDLILVMEGGKIVEAGSLEELRAKKGAFTRLVSRMEGDLA